MAEKTHFLSPFGCFEIQGSTFGISSVKLVDKKPCPAGPIPEALRDCVVQLNEYFKGERHEFSLKLDFGTAPAFHQAVWQELLKVPYGHTTTYKAIAEKLGDPKAVRAVLWDYHFDPARAKTGNWWRRERLRVYARVGR